MKLLLIILPFWTVTLSSQTLTIHLENIRNNKGVFRIGFFTDENSYKEGNPLYYKTYTKANVQNGKLTIITENIEKHQYGIVVLDDENGNNKTDFRMLLPIEGFGFSNYEISLLKIPQYNDFKFEYGGESTHVNIKLKYL